MGHVANSGRERLCPPPDGVNAYIPTRAVMDRRLTDGAYRIICALGFLAGQGDNCAATDAELAVPGVDTPELIRDAISCLERAGYVRVEETPAGRVVHLLWIYSVSMLPPMPDLNDNRPIKSRRRPKL